MTALLELTCICPGKHGLLTGQGGPQGGPLAEEHPGRAAGDNASCCYWLWSSDPVENVI